MLTLQFDRVLLSSQNSLYPQLGLRSKTWTLLEMHGFSCIFPTILLIQPGFNCIFSNISFIYCSVGPDQRSTSATSDRGLQCQGLF